MSTTSEQNLEKNMAVMERDIKYIKESLKEVKDILVAQDLKYAQKSELTNLESRLQSIGDAQKTALDTVKREFKAELKIFQRTGSIIGSAIILYILNEFLKII